ncbi:MAG: hypothetical protein J6W75_06530 [Bacteroidaceae bacterium]|nr:hypothetical protein [Bacteroidaceae bacterium]
MNTTIAFFAVPEPRGVAGDGYVFTAFWAKKVVVYRFLANIQRLPTLLFAFQFFLCNFAPENLR